MREINTSSINEIEIFVMWYQNKKWMNKIVLMMNELKREGRGLI